MVSMPHRHFRPIAQSAIFHPSPRKSRGSPGRTAMLYRLATIVSAGILIGMLGVPQGTPSLADNARPAAANGLVKVKSAYGFEETIARLKADIAAKGITFFAAI